MRKESCADSRAFLRRSGVISDRLFWGELRCRQTTTVGVVVRGLLQEEFAFETAEFLLRTNMLHSSLPASALQPGRRVLLRSVCLTHMLQRAARESTAAPVLLQWRGSHASLGSLQQ